jgi:hypothetical protein
MIRSLAVLAVFALVSIASADVIVYQPASDTPEFNPSYDNLYRPGNAIWRLRQLRLANPQTAYSPLLDTSSSSVVSSAEVARPLEAMAADNARTNRSAYFRMNESMRSTTPVVVEETENPVFLGIRPTTQTPEPNRHIVIEQINPKGADNNPARAGEVIIKPYEAPAKRRPVR